MLVVGAPNSSNSVRLVEVAQKAGCANAMLVQSAREIAWDRFSNLRSLGLTAGASAPEVLVQQVISRLKEMGAIGVSELSGIVENLSLIHI